MSAGARPGQCIQFHAHPCPPKPMLSQIAWTHTGPPRDYRLHIRMHGLARVSGVYGCTWAFEYTAAYQLAGAPRGARARAHMKWHESVCIARVAPCMPGQAWARHPLCCADESDSMNNRCSALVLSIQSLCSKACSISQQRLQMFGKLVGRLCVYLLSLACCPTYPYSAAYCGLCQSI